MLSVIGQPLVQAFIVDGLQSDKRLSCARYSGQQNQLSRFMNPGFFTKLNDVINRLRNSCAMCSANEGKWLAFK